MRLFDVFKRFFPSFVMFYLAGAVFSLSLIGVIGSGVFVAFGISLFPPMMFRILEDLKMKYRTDSVTEVRMCLKKDFNEKKKKEKKSK